MPDIDISQTTTTNMDNSIIDWKVDQEDTDSIDQLNENYYVNKDWKEQYGYYKNVPIAKAKINARARWAIGKGFEASDIIKVILSQIRGIGNESFNSILENQIKTMHIARDSYAEIIRDEDTGIFINLKSLNPGTIRVVSNKKGIIIRYEQLGKVNNKVVAIQTWEPDEILHLCRDRIADNIHGDSMIDAIKKVLDFKEELYENWKKVMQRNVWPLVILEVDTDDTSNLSHLKKQWKDSIDKGEIMLAPKGSVTQLMKSLVTSNNVLNALPTLDYLDGEVDRVSEVPAIISGGAKNVTESSTKIEYLAWQQTVEEDQLYVEEQCTRQLGINIDLVFPASLQNELLSDKQKDVQTGPAQPNELTFGSGQ